MKRSIAVLGMFAASAMLNTPTFGMNDMHSVNFPRKGKQNASDGSKPTTRRKKTKLARKANLKNRK